MTQLSVALVQRQALVVPIFRIGSLTAVLIVLLQHYYSVMCKSTRNQVPFIN
jgi:hypothetical protein